MFVLKSKVNSMLNITSNSKLSEVFAEAEELINECVYRNLFVCKETYDPAEDRHNTELIYEMK